MSRFWSKKTKTITPYVPGEQPRQRIIKLNTNENPYPPSHTVQDVLSTFQYGDLRLYPDPTSASLVATIAAYHGVDTDQVFLGNGSDEVLAFAFQAFWGPEMEQPLFAPTPSYSFYPVYAALYDIPYREIPVNDDFSIDIEPYIAEKPGGVIIANPNAPTGLALSNKELRHLLSGCPDQVVLIDEAYADFAEEAALDLLPEFENLLIVRTLSNHTHSPVCA